MEGKINDGIADIAAAAKNEGAEVSHTIYDVLRNYAELANDLTDYFRNNTNEFLRSVEQAASDGISTATKIGENAVKFINSMIDDSPAGKSSDFHISKAFVNSIFFLTVASIASFIGSYITSPLIAMIFLNGGVILAVVLFIPCIACYVYSELRVRLLAEKRICCAGLVFLHSLFIGFLCQHYWLVSEPYAVTTQLVASFAYPLSLAHTRNRLAVLGSVAGSSIFAHLIHGMMFTNGGMGTFLIISIIYTLLAVALIQYSIAFRIETDFAMMHVAMQYVFLVSICKMYALMVLGHPK